MAGDRSGQENNFSPFKAVLANSFHPWEIGRKGKETMKGKNYG